MFIDSFIRLVSQIYRQMQTLVILLKYDLKR
jgi:hypothetical protein